MNFRRFLFAPVMLFVFSALVFTTHAHPGHDLMAHGPGHVATSPYHLWILGLVALASLGVAQIIRHPAARRALRMVGITALLFAAALWGFAR